MGTVRNSDFKFEKYLIKESSIFIGDNFQDNGEFNISIFPKGKKSGKKFYLTLEISVCNNDSTFKVSVVMDGTFSFRENIQKKDITNFFYLNAPAIMFPYLRGYISTITALSGVGTIILPTMNLTSLAKEIEDNTVEE